MLIDMHAKNIFHIMYHIYMLYTQGDSVRHVKLLVGDPVIEN